MCRHRVLRNLALVFAAVWLTNCLTVNISVNFPEAAVESAADEINREIRGDVFTEKPAGLPSEGTPEERSHLQLPNVAAGARFALSFGLPSAHAQDTKIDLKTTNPIIRKINAQRAERAKALNEFLSKAYIGEATDGYLREMSAIESLPLMELAKARREVAQENKDREALYQEFAKINTLPIRDVVRVFAESNRKWLLAGQFYMSARGEWVKKTKAEEERDRKELKEKGLLE